MSFLNKCVLLFCAFWCVAITSFATQNYFGLNQVSFDGVDYYLRWSANSPANTYIEDFLPKNSPLTRYSEKFSIYYITNKSFDAIVKAKEAELTLAKQESQVNFFYRTNTNPTSDVIFDYFSELEQGGKILVAQHSVFRYVKKGSHVLVFEWVQRSYSSISKFEKRVSKKRAGWVSEISKFKVPSIDIRK